MKVTYLTIEDIATGLFQTQVWDVLCEISHQQEDIEYEIFVVNRPWLLKTHLKKKKELVHQKIKIKYLPLLPPLRDALSAKWYSAGITWWLRCLYWLFVSRRSKILHCRSYWCSEAALRSLDIPVLFDMRSLWPLENISMGLLKPDSATAKYWFALEKHSLQHSYISSGVSQGMIDYCEKIVPSDRLRLIPISVDARKFGFSQNSRIEKRLQLGWQDKTVFVYSGSFGQSSINLSALKELFASILNAVYESRILFLTSEPPAKVHELMANIGIDKNLYAVIKPDFAEMGRWLSSADIGVHALPKQLDFETRLGTKVVEYWINGLPVIVNEFVGAAADIIRYNNIGAVFTSQDMQNINEVNKTIERVKTIERSYCSEYAGAHFSTKVTSTQYIAAYRDCLDKNSKTQ